MKLKDAWELVANYCLLAKPYCCLLAKPYCGDLVVPVGRNDVSFGLCGIISDLARTSVLSESQRITMRRICMNKKPLIRAYKWPATVEGWRARYWFCKRQAAKCK